MMENSFGRQGMNEEDEEYDDDGAATPLQQLGMEEDH